MEGLGLRAEGLGFRLATLVVLKGSWDSVTRGINMYRVLITVLVKSHEPPSTVSMTS